MTTTVRSEPASTLQAARSPASIVLVHDYLLVMRGAERTFEAICACYPGAPVATLVYDRAGTQGRFAQRSVHTSFLQPLAADQRRFRGFLPLLPLAAETLPLGGARVVVSSSSAFAHGVRPHADAVHVSYCHSPLRYLWHERRRTEQGLPWAVRPPARAVLGAVRRWDVRASGRVTAYIANSRLTRERIGDFYGRDATVVYPPVDVARFAGTPSPRDYFLLVGEVTGHKRHEVALSAAERAGVQLKVVGGGPDLDRLRRRFARAEFLGRVDDRRLAELYAGCRALVVPAVEEFGITMVEAQAAGRPVVAAARGGACEIVRDGETGVLVPPGSVDGFAEALREVDWEGFDLAALRANAARFSTARFRVRFATEVARILAQASGRPPDAQCPATGPVPITTGGILATSGHRS